MKIPCAERIPFVVSGLAFFQPALTNSQFYNLTLIATALVLGSKFCLSEINRMWLEKGVFVLFDHALKTNLKAVCIVVFYYSDGESIKFPIQHEIYYKDNKIRHCRFWPATP
ncbi:MAG: hypothetical protein LWW97_08305 [Deltaproteobacteria bacterium]|nr:hypothetical protein [Deltaproteobacteria bacterium]